MDTTKLLIDATVERGQRLRDRMQAGKRVPEVDSFLRESRALNAVAETNCRRIEAGLPVEIN